MKISQDLAWAAGLFDGEGCTTSPGKLHGKPYIRAAIAQVDRRVLDKFQRVVGHGKVYGPYTRNYKKPAYIYAVNGFDEVTAVMSLLWSWLSEIKRNQFQLRAKEHLEARS